MSELSTSEYLAEDERSYLAHLQEPLTVFVRFLHLRYGADVVSFRADTGQIIRATPTLPPERPIEHATPDGKSGATL